MGITSLLSWIDASNIIAGISTITAGISAIIAIFSYQESKKLRMEQSRAFLYMDMMQIDSDIYVVIHNIGHSPAFDISITVNEPYSNRFENLKLIPPTFSYRYLLLSRKEASQYQKEVIFSVKYKDVYSDPLYREERFPFTLADYLKYHIAYDAESNSYDIKKTY